MSYSFVRATAISALLVAAPVAAVAAPTTFVDDTTGTKFAGTQTANGVTYQCLGAGVRKVFFFINVYAATLCVETPSVKNVTDYVAGQKAKTPNAADLTDKLIDDQGFFDAILNAPGGKFVIEHLVRNIKREDMAKAFRESLGKVLPAEKVEKLIGLIPGDPHEGQEVKMYSAGNTLTIELNGQANKIEDAEIATKIWGVFLGKDGVSPTLKKSIAKTAANGI
jgi:hypothetical protein